MGVGELVPGPKKTYREKLLDPRWQKRRLEILSRDAFTCQHCFDGESTLHVHHRWYVKGEPWDVPDEALVTLCESCHEEETRRRPDAEETLRSAFQRTKFPASLIHDIACSVAYMPFTHTPDLVAEAIHVVCTNADVQRQVIDWILDKRQEHRATRAQLPLALVEVVESCPTAS